MDITPFIRDLILLNECVILRGFGGFDTNYKHASVDKKRKVIAPPSKKINFRPEWIKDNGVLEEQLIGTLEIKPDVASKLIDEYVSEVHQLLQAKGTYTMEGIGVFMMSDEGMISFTELENENYLADSFGLDTLEFDLPPLPEKTIPEPTAPKPIAPQKRKFTGWFVAIGLLVLASLVTVLILLSDKGGLSSYKLSSKTAPIEKNSEVIVFGQQKKVLEDSVIQSIEQTLDKNTNPKNALAIKQELPPVTIESATYYLIAGSFKNQKNAEILKNQLEQKGFKPQLVNLGGDYMRVILGTYTNKQEALDELQRIRRQTEQSVWVMEKK